MSFGETLLAKIQSMPSTFFVHWAYPLLFLMAFLESTPFIGFLIPGQVAAILAGLLARLGFIDLGIVLAVAFFGTFLGDIVAYELGRRQGVTLFKRYGKRFFFGPREYKDIQELLDHHPGKAIIIGKFHAITRCFTPFVAGGTELNRPLFFFFNAIGAILWTSCYVFIGYIFGHGFETAARYVGTFALIALVIMFALLFNYRRIQRFVLKHQHRLLRYPFGALSAVGVGLFLFALIADGISDGGAIVRFDATVHAAIPALRAPLFTAVSLGFDFFFNYIGLTLLSLALFAALLHFRRRRTAMVFLISMTLGLIVEQSFKLLRLHARPLDGLITAATGSFPSGHATMATVFCAFALWGFRDDIVDRVRRGLFELSMIALPVLVGLSRLYLGVHWASDVLAGWALGVCVFGLVLVAFHVLKQ